MTDGIKRFAEILERHARIIRNEEIQLTIECEVEGTKIVILRLCHDVFTELMDEGLIENDNIG